MSKSSNISTKIGIRWTIENVSKIGYNLKIRGPDFYMAPECLFNVSFMKDRRFIFVYLSNKSDNKMKIDSKIALFDSNNKKLHKEKRKNESLDKEKEIDMLGEVDSGRFKNLTNDKLIIDLFVNIKEVETKNLNILIYDKEPEKKLREDFKTLLENPTHSDVCLQVGDEQIRAHWAILISRSPYFKRMFDSGMKECVQNSVTITDSSLSTVKKLIQFLYTADFIHGGDLQELFDLYCAADKYEVMDLRNLCGHKIISKATTDNAGEILQLSYRHNDKALKMEMLGFVYLHSDAVLRTEAWKNFEESEPAIAEIFIFFCMKKK